MSVSLGAGGTRSKEAWLQNVTRKAPLASRMRVARTFVGRLVGLLDQPEILPGQGLLIESCRSIHTHFMRFPIDVLYLDEKGRILTALERMKPFRTGPFVKRAAAVVELPAGTIASTGTQVGDLLEVTLFGGEGVEG